MLRSIASRYTKVNSHLASTARNAKPKMMQKNETRTIISLRSRALCTAPSDENPDYAGPEGNRLRAEAQKFAEERHALLTEATKLFEAGDKAKAKELSDKGKAAGKKMEDANAQAAKIILQYRNGEHPENYLDLHGLYLEEALTAFRSKLTKLQASSGTDEIIFEVIPGAGNHSKDKAIIKPKIMEELTAMNLYFEEKNAGSLLVYVNGDGSSTPAEAAAPTTTTIPSNDQNQETVRQAQESKSQSSEEGSTSTDNDQRGFGTFASLVLLGSIGSVAAYAALAPEEAEKDAHNLFKRLQGCVYDITGK